MLDQDFPLAESRQTTTQPLQMHGIESTSLLNRLAPYGRTAMTRNTSASLALMLAKFQQFLFLSCCAVLYYIEAHGPAMFDLIRICLGDVTERYCVQTLRTVVFLNKVLDRLNAHGWGSRASELLLICELLANATTMKLPLISCETGNESTVWNYSIAQNPTRSSRYLMESLLANKFTGEVEHNFE